MKTFLALLVLLTVPGLAWSGSPSGRWQTEAGDSGGHLLVDIGPCASDPALTCGIIVAAIKKDGSPDAAYEHLGKPIVWDMRDDGGGNWSDGMIWAPDRNKTYSSNMELRGSVLHVEGCVAIICRGQDWRQVQ